MLSTSASGTHITSARYVFSDSAFISLNKLSGLICGTVKLLTSHHGQLTDRASASGTGGWKTDLK